MTYQALLAEQKAARKAYWTIMLRECGGSVARTAKRAGVNRTRLHKKLKDLGVHTPGRTAHRGNWGDLT